MKNRNYSNTELSTLEKEILLRINRFAKPEFNELKETLLKQAKIVISNINDYNQLKEEVIQEEREDLSKESFFSVLQDTLQKVSN